MRNRILLVVVVLLIPLVVISFYHKKTNFYLPQNNNEVPSIYLKDYDLKLSLDDYVIGVVAAEMPASFNDEALKAQAVVSRTFGLFQMQKNGLVTLGDQAYITIDEMHDKWQDKYDLYYNKIKNAVINTGNICIYYQNKLIKSYYFAVSSGSTENSMNVFNESHDYLVPVDSSFDKETTKYLSEVLIDMDDFKSKLAVDNIEDIHIIKNNQNYVDELIINNKKFSGINIRKLFNLKSASFDIEVLIDKIKITCYGYGHGVGMSQYGANELAKQNKSYQEIINYYYQNIELSEYHV